MTLGKKMAGELGLPEEYIDLVARTASYRYKKFPIKKADGQSRRWIYQPSRELKLLQRWIVRNIFSALPRHKCAHAYVRRRSIVTNAKAHIHARYISRLDFRNFFPSLTAEDIQILLRQHRDRLGLALSAADTRLITSLVCRNGKLPVGAPSSPTISNVLLYGLDAELAVLAKKHRVVYTRYADDLYFSSESPGVLYTLCREAESVIRGNVSPKLTINKKKTLHASRKRRMAVTGIIVTPNETLSVGHKLKRQLRVCAHLESVGQLPADQHAWLIGMLAFVESVEPGYVKALRTKYQLLR
jgi:RNA-directed DNA polymerase